MSHDFSTVREFVVGEGGRLFVAPTGTPDLVVVVGSVLGGPNMVPKERDVLPALAAMLLDAGTAKKKKSDLRDALAARGISLTFGASGDRTVFSAQCFPEDLSKVLDVLVECLTDASFPESEVKNVKALALGALAEEKSDTGAQAERALAALLYDQSHVNYVRSIAEEEQSVAAVRRADLLKYRPLLGAGGLVLAIAGDVQVLPTQRMVDKVYRKLGKGTRAPSVKHVNIKAPRAAETLVPVPDKATIDVLLGASLPITLVHESYHAMRVLVDALGGGFTAHLMQTIRDRDGLTYGVYAQLARVTADTDGHFKVWASFAPERYVHSVAKLREEIAWFLTKGLTDAVLEQTKARMIGSYLVSLATTQSLASALHGLGTQGRPLSYLTEYPDIIRRVTLADLKKAAALIPLDKLSLAASGTFLKN